MLTKAEIFRIGATSSGMPIQKYFGFNEVEKCKGCKTSIIRKDYLDHTSKCDQFIIECPKCRLKMTKAAMKNHSRTECFSQEIKSVGDRVASINHDVEEINNSLEKL